MLTFARMGQKKLYRFAQIKTFSNVLEYPEDMKGKWREHFGNNHPVILELACGRGEYTVALAKMHPEKNFIGVDVKGNRMYIGAKKSLDEGLKNAAFLRTQIEMLADYFSVDEVDEIWITFPDPQLRTSKAKKRLTHPRFLRIYRSILKKNGVIHLKTDSPQLYLFTKLVADFSGLEKKLDLASPTSEMPMPELQVKTFYEILNIAGSDKVYYLQLSLPEQLENKDEQLQVILRDTEDNNHVTVPTARRR